MSKTDWYEKARYSYNTQTDEEGYTKITFTFPKAATGILLFDTWLYKFKDEKIIEKNMAAEMLQCYIDRDLRS